MKKYIITALITTLLSASVMANTTLDSLLIQVEQEQAQEIEIAKQREAQFLAAKDQQKKVLDQAKAELAALDKITKGLTVTYEAQEKQLAELEQKLNVATGTLGEMFGVVKQISGDLKAQFDISIISAQHKKRGEFIGALAQRKELPNIDELKKLWMAILGEINESGKVVTFNAEVVSAKGVTSEKQVTRIGSFNLFTEGKYLIYQGETEQIIELARQPDSSTLSMLEDFESSKGGLNALALDPSRGTLLSMLVNAPDLFERFQQGGLVGYVIFVLLLIGLVMVGERMLKLSREKKKIMAQLHSKEVSEDNALGQLIKAFKEYKDKDIEVLELKMEESILKSTPPLEKGIGTIKVLAAIAPLMGLLGTVTGMIGTFQSITLFGTGDPKLMAGGISTALVTTVLGLVCAIPLILLHNFIQGKSRELVQLLEEQSAGLLAQRSEVGEL